MSDSIILADNLLVNPFYDYKLTHPDFLTENEYPPRSSKSIS